MGKGDKKTKRGKLFMGSYGASRRRKNAGKRIRNAVSENQPKEIKEIRAAAEVTKETTEPIENVAVVESPQVVEIPKETKVVKANAKEDRTVKEATEKKKPEKAEQETKKVKQAPAAKPVKESPAGDEAPKPKTKKKPAAEK
jgi:ribosomal small subunit protein bTHX